MRLRLGTCLVVGLLAILPLGCEPRPVVVNPDDDETTIIEDEGDVDVVPVTPAPDSGTDVDVGVGGREGVDVNVNPDAGQDSNPNR